MNREETEKTAKAINRLRNAAEAEVVCGHEGI